MGIYSYIEEEQKKDCNGDIQYYEQVKPFTFGKMFSGLVSVRIFGNSAIYYSKETENCLGISSKSTINFFEKI